MAQPASEDNKKEQPPLPNAETMASGMVDIMMARDHLENQIKAAKKMRAIFVVAVEFYKNAEAKHPDTHYALPLLDIDFKIGRSSEHMVTMIRSMTTGTHKVDKSSIDRALESADNRLLNLAKDMVLIDEILTLCEDLLSKDPETVAEHQWEDAFRLNSAKMEALINPRHC